MKKLIALALLSLSFGVSAQTLVRPLQGGTGVANSNSATLTRSGAHALTITTTGATGVTLPTSGTLYASGTALSATTGDFSGAVTGTSASQAELNLVKSGGSANTTRLFNDGTNTGWYDATNGRFLWLGTNASGALLIPGALTISTTMTASALTVAAGTPNSICQNNATKEITVNAALTCTVSSREYKARIEPFSGNGLRMVAAMQPDTFFYRDRLDRPRIGLMAEDLAEIDPRLAEWTAEGKPNSIDFPAMMGVMVKAIQELRAEVESLKFGRSIMVANP